MTKKEQKMKTNALSLLALTGALFLMTACASEETNSKQEQAQKPDTKGLTAFTVDGGATRTTAEYDGSGLNFYWTEGDHLWVNNGTLIQDNSNDINQRLVRNLTTPGGVYRATTAKFYFAGTYTAPSYPVRYTGKGSTAGDKVTIKAQQSQPLPSDASHIGESGDCGTGTAIYSGTGYNFTLDHKASYITFIPYSTQTWATNGALLKKIRVSTGNSSDALTGTFKFSDNGTLSNPTFTSNSVELSLNYFPVPNTSTVTTKTATMVVNPGTYSNVSIEYTLYDQETRLTGTITKTYPSMTFTAGKNKKVHTNLQVTEYPYSFPRYWYETPPLTNCPNVNECLWYAMKGDPHWDATTLWAMRDHLYVRGMWFKKKANISGFTNSNYGGTDYRTIPILHPYITNNVVTQGKPSNPDDYFFLPACGFYYNYGWTWLESDRGYYWAGPPGLPGGSYTYYNLYFVSSLVSVQTAYYGHGMRAWTAE